MTGFIVRATLFALTLIVVRPTTVGDWWWAADLNGVGGVGA